MALIEVDDHSIEATMAKAFDEQHTVILKFGSEWCDSCHALEGELEDVDEDNEAITVLLVDTDESSELAAQFAIRALPTMLIFDAKDSLIHRSEGVMLAQDIEQVIAESKG